MTLATRPPPADRPYRLLLYTLYTALYFVLLYFILQYTHSKLPFNYGDLLFPCVLLLCFYVLLAFLPSLLGAVPLPGAGTRAVGTMAARGKKGERGVS